MWPPWFFSITWASQAIRQSIYLIDTTDEAQSRLKREKDRVWEREWEWEHCSKLKQTSFVTMWIKLAECIYATCHINCYNQFFKGSQMNLFFFFPSLCYIVFYSRRYHKGSTKEQGNKLLSKRPLACERLQAKLLERTGNHFSFYAGDQQDLTLYFSII